MTPKVSVVIPCFNRCGTIGRAIDSVLAQDVPDIEIIVVDDGSTDGTASRLARYAHRITLLQQPNQGVSVARRNGILTARGELLAFLDSDDEWYPNKLSHQLQQLSQYAEVGLVACGAEFVNERGVPVTQSSRSLMGRITDVMLRENPIVTSSVVLRRSCLVGLEPLFRPEQASGEDYELWTRLSARFDFLISPEILVRYHMTKDGLNRKFSAETYRRHYEAINAFLAQDPALAETMVRRHRQVSGGLHFRVAYHLYEEGAYWEARWEVLKALMYSPQSVPLPSAMAILAAPRSVRNLGRQLRGYPLFTRLHSGPP